MRRVGGGSSEALRYFIANGSHALVSLQIAGEFPNLEQVNANNSSIRYLDLPASLPDSTQFRIPDSGWVSSKTH